MYFFFRIGALFGISLFFNVLWRFIECRVFNVTINEESSRWNWLWILLVFILSCIGILNTILLDMVVKSPEYL